jgi:ankyrin repeat protein
MRHVFKGCRDNSARTVEKWVANPLFDPNEVNDGIWSDGENRGLTGWTPLHFACKYWGKETVEILLKAGVDPDSKTTPGGSTPLFVCVVFSNTAAVEILIKNGADVNAVNSEGQTPLIFATLNGSVDCVKLLLTAGADVEVKSKKGMTALGYAKERKIARLLVKAGA